MKRKKRQIVQKKKFDFEAFTKKALRIVVVFAISLFIISRIIDPKLAVFLFIVTAFNASLQKFILRNGFPVDFELSTFATVITTMNYGLKMGLLVAILSKLIAQIATSYFVADHFFMMLTYIVAAIIASIFPNADVLFLGMMIVTFNCILMAWMSAKIMRLDPTSNVSYTATNFIFNFLVFSIFSRLIHSIIV